MAKRAQLSQVGGNLTPTLLDWSTVEGEISARINAQTDRGQAFAKYAADVLFEGATIFASDGGNDRGVDFIAIDDTARLVHVVNSKCVKTHEKSRSNFPSSEVDKTLTFLDELIGQCESLRSCNPTLLRAIGEVWSRFEAGGYTLHLHLCSNQLPLTSLEKSRIELSLRAKKIQLRQHSLIEFSSGAISALGNTSRRLNFQPDCKFERLDGEVRTVVGYVTLAELKRFLSDHDGLLDPALFHGNVRAFLGVRTTVNSDIAGTLNCDDRSIFECLNNGLKIVCDRLVTSVGSFPVRLINPQVVNGLQTSHVCFEFGRQHPTEAEETMILVQISETDDKDRSAQIALASNNQQRVGTRDLRANDELQVKLERQLSRIGFTYIRKQGEPRPHTAQTIDALRLGQIITAYTLKLPDKAKTQTQAIFDELYSEVFDPSILNADRIVALHALHKLIEEKRQYAKASQRRISGADFSEEWIIEGIFHVLFAIRLLMDVHGFDPYSFDKARDLVDEAVKLVGECFTKTRTSAYRYFRLAATRALIEDAVLKGNALAPATFGQMEFDLS